MNKKQLVNTRIIFCPKNQKVLECLQSASQTCYKQIAKVGTNYTILGLFAGFCCCFC